MALPQDKHYQARILERKDLSEDLWVIRVDPGGHSSSRLDNTRPWVWMTERRDSSARTRLCRHGMRKSWSSSPTCVRDGRKRARPQGSRSGAPGKLRPEWIRGKERARVRRAPRHRSAIFHRGCGFARSDWSRGPRRGRCWDIFSALLSPRERPESTE